MQPCWVEFVVPSIPLPGGPVQAVWLDLGWGASPHRPALYTDAKGLIMHG